MPILMMALLALLVFGLIGILLASATVMEHRKNGHAVPGNTVLSATTPAASGANHSHYPKVR
jgi:hypothetical protein